MVTPRAFRAGPVGALRGPTPGRAVLALLLALPLLLPMASPGRGEGAADPAKAMEAFIAQRKAQMEKEERDFQRLLDQGRSLLAEHSYDQAKRVLAEAARLRPADETCARLLAEAEARNPAKAGPERLIERLKEEHQSKNALLQVQLDFSLVEARKALKAGEHARAREHAERVLDSVSCVADAARAAKLRADAEAVLTAARAAGDQAKAAELQAAIAEHKARAAKDTSATLLDLSRQGWDWLKKGDGAKALAIADDMQRLDPGNGQAVWLRLEAQRLVGGAGDEAKMKAERKEGERKLLENLDAEFKDLKDAKPKIVLSGKRHPGDFVARDERPIEAWEQQYRAKLRQPVEVELRDATIAEACRYLSAAADCTMVLDPAVAKDTRRLTLPKMTMSLEHALRWVCRFSKSTYTLRDHAILVTTRGGLLDQPVTRNYDLSSLLIPIRCIRSAFNGGTQADVQGGGGRETVASNRPGLREDETNVVAEDTMGETWVRFIRNTVAPDTWEEPTKDMVQQARQPYTINYRNGRIVVVHTPEVHEQIERLLNDFRRARNLQVHIFARFLVVQTDFLERYDLDLVGQGFDLATDDLTLQPGTSLPEVYGFVSEPTDPWQAGTTIPNPTPPPPTLPVPPPRRSLIGYLYNDSGVSLGGEGELGLGAGDPLSIRCSRMGSHACNALLQAAIKRRKGTVLTAPRLTCFNTQRANFQAVTNYNYIRSLNSDGEPEIGNVPDGIIFDVQPFVSSDRRYITLVLQPQMRTLMNSATLQTSGFTYATTGLLAYRRVNLPDTVLRSIATTVTVPDGGTMLVGGLATVRERSGEASVPILHDIPLLKYLFREWTQFDSRESLLVLVTAEIVPDIFEE
ncbi:MAG: hypothetical protein FJ290_00915 [Planctomycetes bacterium]|nr:hypothetical protein [Planctomycetota bacterium]